MMAGRAPFTDYRLHSGIPAVANQSWGATASLQSVDAKTGNRPSEWMELLRFEEPVGLCPTVSLKQPLHFVQGSRDCCQLVLCKHWLEPPRCHHVRELLICNMLP